MSARFRPLPTARVLAAAVSSALVAALTAVLPVAPAAAVAHWADPVQISGGETDASAVRVVSSADGSRLAAVWVRSTGVNSSVVRSARSTEGGATWKQAMTVGNGDQPQIVMSPDGQRMTVAWVETISGDYFARTRSSSDGGATWTAAKSVSLADHRVGHLRMAASDDGTTITLTWEDIQSGTTPGIQRVRVTTSTDGGATWTAPREVTDVSDYQGKNPAVTVSANGQVQTVVWQARGPSEFSVFAANSSDEGATWSAAPIRVTASAGTPQADTVVSSTDDGRIVTASWQTDVFGSLSIVSSTSSNSGATWADWKLLGEGSRPTLSHDAEGKKWTAVWSSTSSESSVEAALTKDGGSRWTERVALAPPGQGHEAALASSPNGERLVAVWRDDSGRLWSTGSDDGGVTWDPEAVAVADAGAHDPAAAGTAGRRQIAVWPKDDSVQAATAHYKSAQTITFPELPAKPQFSAGPIPLRATASSGLEPRYRSDTPDVCRISGNTAVPVKAGRCKVTATSPASADFEAASPVQRSTEIQRSAQHITFPAPSDVELGAEWVQLKAVASSGLPIVYRSEAPPVCTIKGTTAVLIATGQCVITATQPGNGGYLPADSQMEGFEVKRNGQRIEFSTITNKALKVGTIQLRARSNSGLRIDFTSLTPGFCKVDGDKLRLREPGTCKVRAEQSGNAEYRPAPPVTRSFQIVRQAPTKPTKAVFSLRGATRTLVTWKESKREDGYVVRVNGTVRCRTNRNDTKCTLPYAFGPRSKVTVTAYNDGVPSKPEKADYRVSRTWFTVDSVDFAKKSKTLGARAKKKVASRAAMLARNGLSSVLVTGQTAKSEPRRLAAQRAKAVAKQLRQALKGNKAKVKVTAAARAGQRPKVSRALLWIR